MCNELYEILRSLLFWRVNLDWLLFVQFLLRARNKNNYIIIITSHEQQLK